MRKESKEAYRETHLRLRVINLQQVDLDHSWMHLNHFLSDPFRSSIYSKGILEKHSEFHSWIGPIHYDSYPKRCETFPLEILEGPLEILEESLIPFYFDVLLASSETLGIPFLNKYWLSALTAETLVKGWVLDVVIRPMGCNYLFASLASM